MVLRVRVRPWTLLVGVVLVAILAWLLAHASGEERRVTLYYKDPKGLYLVPVTTELRLPKDARRAAEVALGRLASRVPAHLMAPVPQGSHVEVTRWSPEVASLKVAVAGPALGSGEEQLLAAALVRTAGDMGAHMVELSLVDSKGASYNSEHLDLSEPISPTDPGMENLYLGGDGGGLAVTVYYRVPDTSLLVPLRVPLPADQQTEPLKGGFALLAAGPPADQKGVLAPSLVAPDRWRWLGIDGTLANVGYAGQEPPTALELRSLVLTLTDSGKVQAVRVSAQGGAPLGKVDGFDLSQPLARPATINRQGAR